MPFFKVILSGRGIDCVVEEDRVVGFFTTRLVRAKDLDEAKSRAIELVLTEWRPGGEYSSSNRGGLPMLEIEKSFPVGIFVGIFRRRPRGYTFYRSED